MKIAFLDRDGVINKEINYLYKIEDFRYTDSCIDGLIILRNLGYKFIIVTNQAGLAKGYYTENSYNSLTRWYIQDLHNKGIDILRVYHCPHHPNGIVDHLSIRCDCRKPEPGMFLKALKEFDISLSESLMIGDKLSDIEAAKKAGIERCYLVETGHEIEDKGLSVYPNMLAIAKELLMYE